MSTHTAADRNIPADDTAVDALAAVAEPSLSPSRPRSRDGEQPTDRSFAEAVASYYDDAVRLAWLLCGDRDRAEDAVAEAMAKTYRRWHRQRVENPRAYLRRAVVNEVNSGLRRLARDRDHAARCTGDGRGSRGHDERLADHEVLSAALAQLAPRQRVAVVLAYYEDLSQQQTAEAMGCSVGTAKSNLSRGLHNLRALLDGDTGSRSAASPV